MTLTPALARLAAFAATNGTSHYLVVEVKGDDVLDFPSTNEYGHGRAYAFKQKGAAVRTARSYNLRRDHTFDTRFKVYDVRAHALLETR